VVHVLDASRAVPVTTSLLSDEGKTAFVAQHRADYEALRQAHAAPRQTVVSLETARSRRTAIEWRAEDLPAPAFTGVRVLENFPLATLRTFIDWTPLFHAWGLKGAYPRILEHAEQGEQARQIFADANALLDTIIAKNLIVARGVYGFFPASAVGDDVELYADETRERYLSDSTSSASRQTRKAPKKRWPLVDRSQTSLRRKRRVSPITSAPSRLPAASGSRSCVTGIALRTMTTTPSWPRRSPIDWLRLSPNACISVCAMNGATAATKL
jgi:cobalamin-dependent methionine synthase I